MRRGGPLEGLRIIDLCRLLPGAFATAVLGDLGAEVVKIEQPGIGDPLRGYEPRIGGSSAYSWVVDRNKRSVVIDLHDPRGREVVRRLARTADAAIESFRPGVAAKLGVGPDDLRREHRSLVYCSISGYGASGPDIATAGHDINYAGRAGVLSLIGENGRPTLPGLLIGDLAGGSLNAVSGLLAALWRAARSGEGDHVDISITDGAFALHALYLAEMFADGSVAKPGEDVLTGAFPCYKRLRVLRRPLAHGRGPRAEVLGAGLRGGGPARSGRQPRTIPGRSRVGAPCSPPATATRGSPISNPSTPVSGRSTISPRLSPTRSYGHAGWSPSCPTQSSAPCRSWGRPCVSPSGPPPKPVRRRRWEPTPARSWWSPDMRRARSRA